MAIRNSYVDFEKCHNDEIYEHFRNKNPSEFWKSWNSKFRRNITKNITIAGCQCDRDISNKFAEHFSNIYVQAENSSACNERFSFADTVVDEKRSVYDVNQTITVDLIDKCIARLALGKACGPDDLSAEHIKFAHPSLVCALCILFRLIVAHRYVPNNFGRGVIIPLVKDKSHNLNDIDNYRAITLIPIISKLFEQVLLLLCEDYLLVDELQFGFKRGIGCTNAMHIRS